MLSVWEGHVKHMQSPEPAPTVHYRLSCIATHFNPVSLVGSFTFVALSVLVAHSQMRPILWEYEEDSL